MSEEDYKTAYETVLEANKTYYKEIERLNNIIKEIREYATRDLRLYDNESIEFEISNKLLEILDKGE